jgi:hypothetical protein
MSNDPVFDPVFNTAPQPQLGPATPERASFLFDGWSYEPLAIEPADARMAPAPDPRQ